MNTSHLMSHYTQLRHLLLQTMDVVEVLRKRLPDDEDLKQPERLAMIGYGNIRRELEKLDKAL